MGVGVEGARYVVSADVLLNAGADPGDARAQSVAQVPQRARDGGRVEHGAGTRQRRMHRSIDRIAQVPRLDRCLGEIPVGEATGGEDLADAGRAIAKPDVVVPAHGGRELAEAAVLLGSDEGGPASGSARLRHPSSSS
jgi:hypothetical protein